MNELSLTQEHPTGNSVVALPTRLAPAAHELCEVLRVATVLEKHIDNALDQQDLPECKRLALVTTALALASLAIELNPSRTL
jgi:hypothetical protein